MKYMAISRHEAPVSLKLWFALGFVILSLLIAGNLRAAEPGGDDEDGKLVIRSKSGAKVTIEKAELSRRPPTRGDHPKPSRRASAPDYMDPVPTELDLVFPTLVYPGEEVRALLKFNDPDDYVFTIYVTVFFPDGDVVTVSLYDFRIDGGDVYKGAYRFWVEIPLSETPIPGKIIITASDEYLNVSEVQQNFVVYY